MDCYPTEDSVGDAYINCPIQGCQKGGEKTMQSNSVNAMLLIPKTLGIGKTETAQGLLPRDDTFMHMLSERIAARRENSLKDRPMEAKSNLPRSYVLKDNAKPVNGSGPKTVSKKLNNGSKGITDTSKAEAKGEPEVEGIKNESDEKEKIKEQISSLEALIALLEELMAKLNTKTVSADSAKSDITQESIITTDTKEASLMELLMALMEGNAEKLKTLINELGGSTQTPEIQELVEKIKSLIERLAKDPDMPELKAEIDVESVSKEKLIEQLKAQCGQLIGKLKEQVARLNSALEEEEAGFQTDSLLAGILPEEKVLNESQNVESETKHEAKDAKDGSAAFAKDADTSNVKAGSEIENPFENIIIQNQMPEKNLSQSASLEKAQIPLSEKPLANTVTNQVIMKVKLMAGENKQEMEMHLKPDSLGKLSLKIIHERGEILAKITAENEQVKGIIESNMQMLKDALEKSGFNVQSLSVSVGNDNDKSQNTENGDGKSKAPSVSIGRTTSTSSQVDADKLNLRTRIEKEYYSDTSQINLTA